MAEQAQAAKSSSTVVMGCKMPNGHVMVLEEFYEGQEATPNGFRKVVMSRRVEGVEPIKLNGNAVPFGIQSLHPIVGGYGLTYNVPADFANKWMDMHEHDPIVKNKIIFIASNRDAAEKTAKENEQRRSGLEPLDPEFRKDKDGRIVPNDPRFPRSMSPNLTAPHRAERDG